MTAIFMRIRNFQGIFSQNQALFKHFFKGTLNSSTFQDINCFQALCKTCEKPVLCFSLLLSEICLPAEFHVDTIYCSHILSQTTSKCKNKQRAITLNLGKGWLWFNALHFYSMGSIYIHSFKLIYFIVLKLCPGQS